MFFQGLISPKGASDDFNCALRNVAIHIAGASMPVSTTGLTTRLMRDFPYIYNVEIFVIKYTSRCEVFVKYNEHFYGEMDSWEAQIDNQRKISVNYIDDDNTFIKVLYDLLLGKQQCSILVLTRK